MKTNFSKVVDLYMTEYFIDNDTAIELMIKSLSEHGHVLPFSTPAGYREYEINVAAEEALETEERKKESELIKKLKYKSGTIQHKKEIFRINWDSYQRNHGYTALEAFESSNKLNPGIFNSLADLNSYIKSLKFHMPEMEGRGPRRF